MNRKVIGLMFCAWLVPLAPVLADHERATELRESGDILSLETILERAQKQHSGRVLEVELEEKRGRYIYEVEILDQDGTVWEMYYDARSGELLRVKQED